MTHDETKESPAVQINNARQLLALVKERPCINPRGTATSRACAIGYAEITVLERMLKSAVDSLLELDNAKNKFAQWSSLEIKLISVLRVSNLPLDEIVRMLPEFPRATLGRVLDNLVERKIVFRNLEDEFVLAERRMHGVAADDDRNRSL